MSRITLIAPSAIHENGLNTLYQTLKAKGLTLHGGAGFEKFDDYNAWLAFVRAPRGTPAPDNSYRKVADSTYVALQGEQVIGIINIRHELTDFLRQIGGHIGYAIHPGYWNQGYATEMLALTLEKTDALHIDTLLLTCSADNPASARVIEKNGGILEKTVEHEGMTVQHYRIHRKLPLEKAPSSLVRYKQMPVWTRDTIPEAVLAQHNTKVGTWGKLRVLGGSLTFHELNADGTIIASHQLTPDSEIWTIYPQQWHKVEPHGDDFAMQLEFHCEPTDYVEKKYGMTATHSAIKAAVQTVPVGKTLDLGCGHGRNALYLALLGYDVTALDHNPEAIASLAERAAEETLPLRAATYDINNAHLTEQYDFIFSTVVFMFLQAERIPAIIADMQAHTQAGGYNLIVCAMDTDDYPCHMPFSFTFKAGELRQYYRDWQLHTYEEAPGNLHATDKHGNPVRLKFVTMLAQKG
ncbi:MAG: SAM-dependent methyltransferase TehB [Cardiobacteriaceae bacterium]|nr:SAM-dependent methyltransferase TehB [Cardiobacteriaceae bacterium]